MTRRKRKIYSWIVYICIAIVIQCFCIVAMVEKRGEIAVGSEYLIIPVMIAFRVWIPNTIAGLNNLFYGEEEDV